jgi:hypothetical protein
MHSYLEAGKKAALLVHTQVSHSMQNYSPRLSERRAANVMTTADGSLAYAGVISCVLSLHLIIINNDISTIASVPRVTSYHCGLRWQCINHLAPHCEYG